MAPENLKMTELLFLPMELQIIRLADNLSGLLGVVLVYGPSVIPYGPPPGVNLVLGEERLDLV